MLCVLSSLAANIKVKGAVKDKLSKEPLIGATIRLIGTQAGAVTDMDGNFELNAGGVLEGMYDIEIKYVGYKTEVRRKVRVENGKLVILNLELETDAQELADVVVVAKKNRENENMLLLEQQKAVIAVQSVGVKELSRKGVSDAEGAVTKVSGVSKQDGVKNVFVRGLGDRYSSTTLNGLPIASPNPDNKLIPLDLFPSSTVQNITVSKVYDASAFADYSGAHIDISTKENVTDEFLNVSFNVGGRFNTLGRDFYQMDRDGTLFKTPSLDEKIYDMPLLDFDEYVTKNNIFRTTFDVDKRTALPEFGGNLGFGRNFGIGDQTLSLLASLSLSNETQRMDDAFYKTLEATGNVQNDFTYDEYTATLKMAALASVGYTLRQHDRIG